MLRIALYGRTSRQSIGRTIWRSHCSNQRQCCGGSSRKQANTSASKRCYGGLNGILGILNEELIDINEEKAKTIAGLKYTPAAGLGTCRYKIDFKKKPEKAAKDMDPFVRSPLQDAQYPLLLLRRWQ